MANSSNKKDKGKNKKNDTTQMRMDGGDSFDNQSSGGTSGKQKLVIGLIIAFILGIGLGFILSDGNSVPATDENSNATSTATTTDDQTDDGTSVVPSEDLISATSTRVSAERQAAGGTVTVSAEIDRTGWAVVYEDRNGQPGNILGAKLIPQPGSWNGDVPLLRNTQPSSLYYVKLHDDNGDREFNHEADLPITDEAGEDIMTTFETAPASPRG